jgi:hypothetical protein
VTIGVVIPNRIALYPKVLSGNSEWLLTNYRTILTPHLQCDSSRLIGALDTEGKCLHIQAREIDFGAAGPTGCVAGRPSIADHVRNSLAAVRELRMAFVGRAAPCAG